MFFYSHCFCTVMDIDLANSKSSVQNGHDNSDNGEQTNAWARHNVQFYLFPPQETISLTELRILASFRQKVLNAVESAGLKFPKQSNDYQRELDYLLRDVGFKIGITTMSTGSDVKSALKKSDKEKELLELRRTDYISHFILRLAYCLTPDLRQWFIQQEVELFRFRLSGESPASVKMFLRLYGIAADVVAADSKEREELDSVMKQMYPPRQAPAGSEEPDPQIDIFKVPFIEATDLVRNRKVYLRRGMAYVPYRELTSVLVGRFRSNLSRTLTAAAKFSDIIQDDTRLMSVLKITRGASTPAVSAGSQGSVTADAIDSLSSESFPPCMRVLYKHVHTRHHMRHHGRMQLGLFLKGIGMSMEESLKFWKNEFQPLIGVNEFDSKYAYNIRHNYGKEGKRVDYSPYNCVKVINLPPQGPSDCHGCPFKTMDAALLQQHLQNWGLSTEQQETVVQISQRGFYDKACTRFFEFRHGLPEESRSQLISHPNQFFDDSRKLRTTEMS